MKKILIVFALTLAVSAGKAQNAFGQQVTVAQARDGGLKQNAGSLALEAGFSPFAQDGKTIQGLNDQIRLIYAVSDRIGIRLRLGVNMTSNSNDNNQTGDEWSKSTGSDTEFSLAPGIAYYFAGTDNLSPFIGVEAILGASSNNITEEGKDYKVIIKNEGELFNTFGLGLFTGFNYYFTAKLYVGAELGLALKSRSLKNTVTETTANGRTETVEPKNEVSQTAFGTQFTPSLRLGWVF
ncbi:MAG: outer membrane beta-barrel protein [Tannerella sp.]|jgi:hypothetical protein|nr:outer membrane beta-barrel protein [Tannerella sp.]